jgi:hypothetical protein
MMRLLPLLLAALALAGCRESLTGPILDPDPIDDAPGPAYTSIYVKVTGALDEGETGQLRAEHVAEAVRYEWTFRGDGDVTTNPADPSDRARILTVVGLVPGDVLATATALDAQGNIVGVGAVLVQVVEG